MTGIKITVLGAGNMGTAVAYIAAKNGHRVWLWDYNPETVQAMKQNRENRKYLPGIKLSTHITPEARMDLALAKARLIVIAVASPYARVVTRQLRYGLDTRIPSPRRAGGTVSHYPIVAHVAKGLEVKTKLTMHEVVQAELPAILRPRVVTVSGPSLAKEFARGVPTAVVAASQDTNAAELVQGVFNSAAFKVVTSSDWKGVGLCGALKNVYAIALGMCDGMRFQMNAKAFMLTAALDEMALIVRALGGQRETVYGLAGLGDMIVTGLGEGRDRALGERICKEGHCRFVRQKDIGTVEGVGATKVFYQLMRRKKVRVPLLELVYGVLYRGTDPCLEVKKFFSSFKF